MPVIDLPEEPPLPGANTVFFPTFAVMLYPQRQDEEKRLHWFASAMAGSYASWQAVGADKSILGDFHGWIGVLWEFSQAPRRVYQDGMARVARAALSGHLLLYLLRLAKYHTHHCFVERAKALVVEFAPQKGETVSESLVGKAWAEFKSVSPFWAAMTILHSEGKLEIEVDSNEDWLAFVGIAEAYRRAAEGVRLLASEETWRAPATFDIPDADAKITPLGADMLAFLDQQFPSQDY